MKVVDAGTGIYGYSDQRELCTDDPDMTEDEAYSALAQAAVMVMVICAERFA